MQRIKFPLLLQLLLGAALLCPLLNCQDPKPKGVIKLGETWQIKEVHKVNEALQKKMDPSTGPLRQLSLPGNWNHILNKHGNRSAHIELRKEIHIPRKQNQEPLILSMGRISQSDQTYFNGQLVGATGQMPATNTIGLFDISWSSPRNYLIPAHIIKQGRTNTISVKAYSYLFSGVSEEPVLYEFQAWNNQKRPNTLLQNLFPKAIPLINALLFIFFLSLIVGTEKKTLWVHTLLIFLLSSTLHIMFLDSPFHINGLLQFKIITGLSMLLSFSFLRSIEIFTGQDGKTRSRISLCILITLETALLLVPDTDYFINYYGKIFLFFRFVHTAYLVRLFSIALLRNHKQYALISICAVPVLLTKALALYNLYNLRLDQIPYMSMLNVPCFLSGAVLYYILTLKNKNKTSLSKIQFLTRQAIENTKINNLKRAEHPPLSSHKPKPNQIIHNLIRHLDANYRNPYNRKELANDYKLNDNYMVQVFKKTTGQTITAYINQKRIHAAQELLKEQELKVIDIAFHIGFDNLSNFYRAFKKETGLSPGQYKNVMARNNA